MRNHDSSHSGNKSLRLAAWFLFALFVILVVSVGIKTVVMVQRSVYDGAHRFTLFLTDAEGSRVVSLEPQGRTVILRFSGKQTKKQVESALRIPFDGSMTTNHDLTDDSSATAILGAFLFSPATSYELVTPYDVLQLYIISLQETKDSINESVKLTKGTSPIDPSRKLFVDAGILSDNKTVAIVNSTGVSGLAQLLEEVLTTLGGSVVSVTTGRELQTPTHILFSGNKSYTVKRFERIFHQQAEEGDTGAADILVVLGKRSLPLGIFATLQE